MTALPPRIHLSPPHVGDEERRLLTEAFDSNWIAPLGPHVDAFEREFAGVAGSPGAVALSSGTAALHLALRLAGVERGDLVYCSTLTFVASANPILYEGASPVFVDSDRATWNMDPELLAEALEAAARRGRLPRAVVVVHLYGQCADLDRLLDGVPVLRGAAHRGRGRGPGRDLPGAQPRSPRDLRGVLLQRQQDHHHVGRGHARGPRPRALARARILAAQARDPAPHYQHSALGFNYRMSNLLAAIGRAQLRRLAERVAARRRNFSQYCEALGATPGLSFMPEASYGRGFPLAHRAARRPGRVRRHRGRRPPPPRGRPHRGAARLEAAAPAAALRRGCPSSGDPWPRTCSVTGSVCPAARP